MADGAGGLREVIVCLSAGGEGNRGSEMGERRSRWGEILKWSTKSRVQVEGLILW